MPQNTTNTKKIPKYTKEYVQGKVRAAFDNAFNAAEDYLKENKEGFLNCGFAWVTVSPARGVLVNVLKETYAVRSGQSYGSCGERVAGITVWNPAANGTQDMTAKEVGCAGFIEVLKEAFPEYTFRIHTRLD